MLTRKLKNPLQMPKRPIASLSLRTVEGKILQALSEAIEGASGQNSEANLFSTRSGFGDKVRIVVGFSGGRDSVALLKSLCVLRDKRNSPVADILALHVHHSLSPNANKWARFCRHMAEDLDVQFKVMYVRVKSKGEGIEAAARESRYDAIFKAAASFDADMVMTAHHQDDRLETFLIQWMRGAGPDGLATFPMARTVGSIKLVRPLMRLPRGLLERYIELYHMDWVEDESNADTAYLRNAIRHEVLPVLEAIRPGFKDAAARSVELVAQSASILRDVALEDLKRMETPDHSIELDALLQLPHARQALVLRSWIESFGLLPPSKAKLEDALRQARLTGNDTKLTIKIGTNMEIRRHGNEIVMRESVGVKKDKTRFEVLHWQGPGRYSLPSWGGELVITEASTGEAGIEETYLRDRKLQVKPRQGGEKLKLYRNRPRKYLKDLYQKAGIAEFDRPKLPLLWSGEDLIFVAGLGMDVRYETDDQEVRRYHIEFKKDETLLSLMQD